MGRSLLGREGHFQQREQPMQRLGVKPCLPYPPVVGGIGITEFGVTLWGSLQSS